MEPRPQLSFEPFRLDPDNACLWRGSEAVPLKPKAFAVLQCLVEHAGRLVTKEVLLQSVWPDSAVSDAVLKVCISEIRKAMDDTAEASRFIVTVHRRGIDSSPPWPPPGRASGDPRGRCLPRRQSRWWDARSCSAGCTAPSPRHFGANVSPDGGRPRLPGPPAC
jgi:hypothetical protein